MQYSSTYILEKAILLSRYHVSVRIGGTGIRVEGEEIEIGIKSEPKHGRANRELAKKLAMHFDVPVQNVKIVSGHTSRRKLVEIFT